MQNIMVIAIGGALGALSRYGLGSWISSKWNQGFPLHTFIINITGAFFIRIFEYLIHRKIDYKPLMAVRYWYRLFRGLYYILDVRV